MVFEMGRHRLASSRRKSSAAVAAAIAPVAVCFAGGSGSPFAEPEAADPVAEAAPCCWELVAAPAAFSSASPIEAATMPASRLRVVSRFLPAGVAPERGLQVKTILTARSISDAFPRVHEMGGVRADAMRWHPNGLALDVIIPNPGTAEGIALGDEIVAFALKNADRFGLQDAIWRGVYYTPDGRKSGGYGHFDHVHITTTGGGYPSGNELYLR